MVKDEAEFVSVTTTKVLIHDIILLPKTRIKGSFALGDDDLISFCRHEWVAWIPM